MQAKIKNEPTIYLEMSVTQAEILMDFAAEIEAIELNTICERIYLGFPANDRDLKTRGVTETLDAIIESLQPVLKNVPR